MLTLSRPCRVQPGGKSVHSNPQSWNKHANIIFLDQPVGSGFSYANGGLPSTPASVAKAAVDVHAFLRLFFDRFPELGLKSFHIAAESYGGHWAPEIASAILHANRATNRTINLASVMLGNAMTDPLRQLPKLPEYICDGPYAFLEPGSKECTTLHNMATRCERMIKACYDYNNAFTCTPAEVYCRRLMNPALSQYMSSVL
jgi:cathepsin A (carboxypeptidase C)